MIKAPAAFLSFDDQYIKEWHETLPMLERYGAKATFYVSLNYPQPMDDGKWRLLIDIRNAGHAIGYHGVNHVRTGAVIEEIGWKAYKKKELTAGLKIFNDHGFNNLRHFSYPYGQRSDDANKLLQGEFDTLRVGGGWKYAPQEIQKARMIHAMSFGARVERKFGHFKNAMDKKKVFCFYIHNPKGRIVPKMSHPMEYWLERALDYGRRRDAKFYSMEALDR